MEHTEKYQSLTFIDLFSGIGGFRLGMEKAGHRCVGFCEIDKYARTSYKSIFDTTGEVELHDITTVTDESIRAIGSVDVVVGGFPCQAFSVAGKRRGFDDTRGTLFFEIARFASILRPSLLFLENVTGLLNHESGATFETILRTLDELGYDVEWECINSKAYIPQNRERLFIVGHSRESSTRKIFPISRSDTKADKRTKIEKVGNIRKMGKSQSGDVVSPKGIAPTMCSTTTQKDPLKIIVPTLTPGRLNKRQNGRRFKKPDDEMFTLTAQDTHGIMIHSRLPGEFDQATRVYDEEGISPCLTTMSGGDQTPKIAIKEATSSGYKYAEPGDSVNTAFPDSDYRRGRVGKGTANTILTSSQQGVLTEQLQIRRLTPLECWRLQTFPDIAFYAAKFGSMEIAKEIINQALNHYECSFEQKMSDSQLYKQAGNSVTVEVIYQIAKNFSKH
ncbi:DNA cytosine methyltransferase [Enterococcus hulanensis]|uniref:DNA cytosine methyltransferase n=1 Tax=Enterococcus hulanensis TaxID=2559929 RepID=UPI0010F6592C|nr:DNA (cytosine-5-)-methyltransferase [Enterococcus hulanensis]